MFVLNSAFCNITVEPVPHLSAATIGKPLRLFTEMESSVCNVALSTEGSRRNLWAAKPSVHIGASMSVNSGLWWIAVMLDGDVLCSMFC